MIDWQPDASVANLQTRASIVAKIRQFFLERDVLEVETPLLCRHTVTDMHIESFKVADRFLQTSPEYAMKRLLAAGLGSIYQICKAFRLSEQGHEHNPEFTMLEWYRLDFDHHALMAEVDQLVQMILNTAPADKVSYREIFIKHCALDPLTCTLEQLHARIAAENKYPDYKTLNFDDALQWLFSEVIESNLAKQNPIFVYDFPPGQAALAKIRQDDQLVAERFELYYQGKELANGFHELQNSQEQRARFLKDQQARRALNRFVPEVDERLLAALESGLPACAGVAMGVDRLVMIAVNTPDIRDVFTFGWERI